MADLWVPSTARSAETLPGGSATAVEVARFLRRQGDDFVEVGATGHQRFGNWRAHSEADHVQQLRNGVDRIKAMREIADNDPVAFASLAAVDLLTRQVEWRVDPFSDKAKHRQQAEFLEEAMKDMTESWSDMVSEAMTMVPYGLSVLEVVMKKRKGANWDNPKKHSNFKDNKIGWARFAPRAPWTFLYWIYDDDNNLRGCIQLAAPTWREKPLDFARCLYCRPRKGLDNPWGVSALRGAYVPYFFLKRLREIEGIGIERDLTGLPIARIPSRYLSSNATEAEKVTLRAMETMVRNVRRDAQEGVVFPRDLDDKGNPEMEFELMTSGGTRAMNPHEVITRWEQRLASSLLTDFIMLGQGEGAGGSYALSADKSTLFKVAIETYLGVIADEINRKAVSRLARLNLWNTEELPQVVPGAVAKQDAAIVGAYLNQLAGSGAPIWPNPELHKWTLSLIDAPEPTDEVMAQAEATDQIGQLQGLGLDPAGLMFGSDPAEQEGEAPPEDASPGEAPPEGPAGRKPLVPPTPGGRPQRPPRVPAPVAR